MPSESDQTSKNFAALLYCLFTITKWPLTKTKRLLVFYFSWHLPSYI